MPPLSGRSVRWDEEIRADLEILWGKRVKTGENAGGKVLHDDR
jgi:hypothetical protein